MFADDRGDLVIKLKLEDVKAVLDAGSATFVVAGTTKLIGPFGGSDTIQVIAPNSKKK